MVGYAKNNDALNLILSDYVKGDYRNVESEINNTQRSEDFIGKGVEQERIDSVFSTGSNSKRKNTLMNEENIYNINEDVGNSSDEGGMTDIMEYITQNFDSQFDINRFEVTDLLYTEVEETGVTYGALVLDYKVGDFVTESGYYVTLAGGEADEIFIKGNPSCEQQDTLQLTNHVDED